jgi:chlorophyllide a oxygenase
MKKHEKTTPYLNQGYDLLVNQTIDFDKNEQISALDLRKQLINLQTELKILQNTTHAKIKDIDAKISMNSNENDKALDKLEEIEKIHSHFSKEQFNVSESNKNNAKYPHIKSLLQNKHSGLTTSFKLEPELKEFWYPLEFSRTLEKNVLIPLELFDDSWVLFRNDKNTPSCIKDSCAHRACPLSLGKVENGELSCAYHGWRFNGNGNCTTMPSTVFVKGISVPTLPCIDVDGLIWVYPGEKKRSTCIPTKITEPPLGYNIHAELLLDVPTEHGLLIENLLDLAHAPFTHTNTFARGWPVPDLVAFNTVGMLGGHWHPYPIDMSFAPPCMTLSTIGLSQPGKIEKTLKQEECRNHLHQLHVCLPTGKGRTRLLYRMSLDFIPWMCGLPFIDRLWKRVADEVLNEDLRLVVGQQSNLIKDGPSVTWGNPVPYDKLAVRYRRWRTTIQTH